MNNVDKEIIKRKIKYLKEGINTFNETDCEKLIQLIYESDAVEKLNSLIENLVKLKDLFNEITIEEIMNIPELKTFEEGLGAKKGIMYMLNTIFED